MRLANNCNAVFDSVWSMTQIQGECVFHTRFPVSRNNLANKYNVYSVIKYVSCAIKSENRKNLINTKGIFSTFMKKYRYIPTSYNISLMTNVKIQKTWSIKISIHVSVTYRISVKINANTCRKTCTADGATQLAAHAKPSDTTLAIVKSLACGICHLLYISFVT